MSSSSSLLRLKVLSRDSVRREVQAPNIPNEQPEYLLHSPTRHSIIMKSLREASKNPPLSEASLPLHIGVGVLSLKINEAVFK